MVKHQGIVHISRFVADENMNTAFRQKQGDQAMLKPLKQVGSLRLTIEKLGQFDSLAFKEDIPSSDELDVNFVEIEVKAVGLNAKVSHSPRISHLPLLAVRCNRIFPSIRGKPIIWVRHPLRNVLVSSPE